jgi:hypothetical protein
LLFVSSLEQESVRWQSAMIDNDPFAPDRWEISTDKEHASARPLKEKCSQTRRANRFLKGPVPWPWLLRAMTLPGKALAIGLMLWLRRGIAGRRTVHFCLGTAEGISPKSARCAIRWLEAAGLIAVVRQPGRGLNVTILDAPEEADQAEPKSPADLTDVRSDGNAEFCEDWDDPKWSPT